MKIDSNRAVACIRFVRLAGPLAGQYCHFATGEPVKVTTTGNGLATVERATWRNTLTICNVLYGVPEHLVCEITETEPNNQAEGRSEAEFPPAPVLPINPKTNINES